MRRTAPGAGVDFAVGHFGVVWVVAGAGVHHAVVWGEDAEQRAGQGVTRFVGVNLGGDGIEIQTLACVPGGGESELGSADQR